MNIAQIQQRGLAPMHTDHSRTAAGENTAQDQFSELIHRMLGSGPVSLTEVGFIAPELRVELKESKKEEELKATEEEVVEEEDSQEEEAVAAEEEVAVASQAKEESLETVAPEVAQEVVAMEGTDRSLKEHVAGMVVDKDLQAAKGRETVQKDATPQVEVQQDLSDGQNGNKGNNAEKVLDTFGKAREESKIKDFVEKVVGKDSVNMSMVDEAAAPQAPAASGAEVKQAAVPLALSEIVHAPTVNPGLAVEAGLGDKGSLGNQVSAISGLGDGKGAGAHNDKGAKTPLAQKAATNQMVEKIRELIAQANQSKDANTISVRINPVDLGVMTVKISQRGDQTTARIIPESQETENMLRGKVNDIALALQNSGIKADNLNIIIGQEKVEADFFGFAQSSGFGNGFGEGQSGLAKEGDNTSREKGWTSPAERLQGNKTVEKPGIDQGWIA